MHRLTRSRLLEILDQIRSVRVGVIGDFNLDAYWYADMTLSQLSREAPLFPRPVVRETYTPGGAANVAWNLAALKVSEVQAFTVLGSDWRGDLLVRLLEGVGIDLDTVQVSPVWTSPMFGKVILNAGVLEQEDSRVDFVNQLPLNTQVAANLLREVEARLPQLDALVVADYNPVGVLSDGLRAALNRLARQNTRVKFIADSRDHIGAYPAMVLKPNEMEAARLFFPDRSPQSVQQEEIEAAGLQHHLQTRRPIVITLGERGCLLFDSQRSMYLPAIPVLPPIDPVGAGDTFLASLAACLASGAKTWEACMVAALSTAVTIRCLRVTGTASPDLILEQYDSFESEVNIT